MNSNTGTLVRRQNSFGRDLGDPGGQGQGPGLCGSQNHTPTSFRTLPRIKACEGPVNPSPSAFVPVPQGSRNGGVGFCSEVLRPTPPQQSTLRAVPKPATCPANTSSGSNGQPCSMQVTYSSCSNPSTTPAPTSAMCSDSRCQVGSCATQQNQENGFNSSCQQCLAERAAAESNSSLNRINQFGTNAAETTSFSPDHKSLDRSRSRLDFSPIHDECNEPMTSLATSVLSTKNLVESCDDHETRGARMTNPSPGRTYECEDLCRRGSMIFFSTVGITIITVGYIVLGAIIFSTIEAKNLSEKLNTQNKMKDSHSPTVMNSTELIATLSEEVNSYLAEIRAHTVKKLWEMTEKMNILYPKNWTHNAAEEILSFQDLLSRKLAVEIISRPKSPNAKPSASGTFPYPNPEDWDFSRGLLYSLTLLTTVGSGCDGVSSAVGRVISVIYVIIGVPLMFIYLARIGRLLANMVRCFCCNLASRSRHPNPKSRPRSHSANSYYATERGNVIHQGNVRLNEEKIIMTPVTPDQSIRGLEPTWSIVPAPPVGPSSNIRCVQGSPVDRPNVVGPILICIFLMLSYISCSAVLMSKIQSWTFLDSFYFCFMSIFTVGFGGLQLSQSNLAACVIYIFIGLILVSTCGHIFYEEVIVKLNLYSLAIQASKPRHLGSQENLADRKADNVLS